MLHNAVLTNFLSYYVQKFDQRLSKNNKGNIANTKHNRKECPIIE